MTLKNQRQFGLPKIKKPMSFQPSVQPFCQSSYFVSKMNENCLKIFWETKNYGYMVELTVIRTSVLSSWDRIVISKCPWCPYVIMAFLSLSSYLYPQTPKQSSLCMCTLTACNLRGHWAWKLIYTSFESPFKLHLSHFDC